MDSWKGQNYYTRNTTRWVQLMNSSTAEWRIGFFPANVVAIPGRLNDNYDFPSNTTVIQNASKTTNKKVPPESVVFIVVSIVVVLCMVWWAIANRSEIFSPRKPQAWKSTEPAPTIIPDDFVQAYDFDHQLQNFYYNGDKSLPEVQEKDPRVDVISTEDIEDAGALFRKMYGLDMSLWATQNSRQVTVAEQNKMKHQSDAILSEVRRLVDAWHANMDSPHTAPATEAEQRQLNEIQAQLNNIADERYPDKTPLYGNSEAVYTGSARRRRGESRNNLAR